MADPKVDELNQLVDNLQASVDAKQDAIATAIKDLQDQVASGSSITPADLEPIIAKLQAVQQDVDSTPTA